MGENGTIIKAVRNEIPYLHLVRVVACVMVLCLHSLPTPEYELLQLDGYFKTVVIWMTRPCVPLFLMITGVLLLPYRGGDVAQFYKKRLSKILFPLLFWGIVYAVLPYLLGVETMRAMWRNLLLLPITYPTEIGGILWYLYILIGLYLIIPFLNPSVFENRKRMLIYISIWFGTSFLFIFKHYFPLVFGMTPFCESDLFLYFSGYLGYLFLGKYLHTSESILGGGKIHIQIKLASVYFLCMLTVAFIQYFFSYSLTTFLHFTSIIMAAALFLFLKEFSFQPSGRLYKHLKEISALSFGIYLSHMVIYRTVTIRLYDISTSLFMQLFVMVLTFMGAWLLTIILSKLPFKKYIIGI